MHKRHRNLFLLIALVVLPLVMLGWQGWRLLASDREVQQARVNQLVEARLLQVDQAIQRYLDSLADDWRQRLPAWPRDPQGLRQQLAGEIRVRHLFLLDAQNVRRYPTGMLSSAEQAFVTRLEAIWQDPSLLQMARPADAPLAEPAQADARTPSLSSVFRKQASETASIPADSGWYMWHWGAGTRLLFWWRSPRGETIGLALEPSRLKADLIGLLRDLAGAGLRGGMCGRKPGGFRSAIGQVLGPTLHRVPYGNCR